MCCSLLDMATVCLSYNDNRLLKTNYGTILLIAVRQKITQYLSKGTAPNALESIVIAPIYFNLHQ